MRFTCHCLPADGNRAGRLDYDSSKSQFPIALGVASAAPDYCQFQGFPWDSHRAQFSHASIGRPLNPTCASAAWRGLNTPGVIAPSPVRTCEGPKKSSPGSNCIMGMRSLQHGWVKPVRFSMVRCPKRLRVKLRTPNRRKEKAFSPVCTWQQVLSAPTDNRKKNPSAARLQALKH